MTCVSDGVASMWVKIKANHKLYSLPPSTSRMEVKILERKSRRKRKKKRVKLR